MKKAQDRPFLVCHCHNENGKMVRQKSINLCPKSKQGVDRKIQRLGGLKLVLVAGKIWPPEESRMHGCISNCMAGIIYYYKTVKLK